MDLALQTLQELKEIEKKAGEIKEKAYREAEAIIREAERKGENIMASTLEETREKIRKQKKEAEKKAAWRKSEILKESETHIKKIKEQAGQKRDQACQFLLKKVVGHYGSH